MPEIRPAVGHRIFVILLLVGAVVRIAAAVLATNSQDVALFGYIVTQGAQGHSLYDDPVFSYPPLVGYLWLASGKLLSAFGVPIVVHVGQLAPFAVPGLISADLTTPIASLLIKAPAILADAALVFVVDRACRRAGAGDAARRVAVLAVWLNPLVIFDSAVQASWDALVPLSVIAAGAAAIDGEGASAGAWLAAGTLAKIVPITFIPLVAASLVRAGSASRRIAAAILFGIVLLAIGFAPVAASGGLLAVRDAIGSRSTSAIFGGFNAWTSLHAFALAPAADWVAVHGTLVATIASLAQLLCIIVVAFAFLRTARPTTERWMLAATATFATILVVAPYVQPGYVVWIVPACAILGACGRPHWNALGYLASACAFVFALTVRAPAALVAPACWFFRLCDPVVLARAAQAYAYAQGSVTPLEQVDAGVVLGLTGTLVFLLAAWLAFVDWRRLRDA